MDAIKYFQKSLSEHRTPEILAKLQETEKLKATREKESYQNPELSEEARNKGNERFKANDYAGAVPFYTESINRAEKDPRGYSNRAACYMKLMALPEAMNDVEKAISLDPTFSMSFQGFFLHGLILLRFSVKAYIRKAAIQFTMKEYAKCVQTCDDALAVDEEHHESKNRVELEGQKQKATMAMYGMGGATDAGDENMTPEQRMQQAMRDPKVQEIMGDPVMRQLLEQMSQDPNAARDHMKNPMIREKIQILANAGIIGIR